MKISLVIITYNEEKYIKGCIESAKDIAEEVIVVDSYSKDRTVQIAKSLGAKVIEREFKGYADQKNFALEQATGDWIISLDADERLSEELKDEIRNRLGKEDYVAYYVPRKNYYMGAHLKCWSPDRIVRIVKKGKARWQGLVHEKMKVDGKTGIMKNPIIHFPFEGLKDQYEKNLKYAYLLAQEKYEKGIKFKAFDLILRPHLNFLKHFILKGCIKEGMRGLIFSLFYFSYTVFKYSFLYELEKGSKKDGKDIRDNT